MSENRVYFAGKKVAIAGDGETSYTNIHGLTSMGVTTRFNIDKLFQFGESSTYDNVENIPDVEVTMEKYLDGYPPMGLLLTKGSSSPSLQGRSTKRAIIGYEIYPEEFESASGTPLTQCQMSGIFLSSWNFNIPVQGQATESVTAVGNNKIWGTSLFSTTDFDNTDSPAATEGVNLQEDILFGEHDPTGVCKLPTDIYGISSSGYNPYNTTTNRYGAHIQSIRVAANLGRTSLFELGRRGPYHRYIDFPVTIQTDIDVTSTRGDQVDADEFAAQNTTDQEIVLRFREGLKINLGTNNRLVNSTDTGGNAQQGGGNNTITFSYENDNYMTVVHPQDPSNLWE